MTPFESIETIGQSPQRAAFVLGLLVYPAGDALNLPLVWGVFFYLSWGLQTRHLQWVLIYLYNLYIVCIYIISNMTDISFR